jgi:hypothetical protein
MQMLAPLLAGNSMVTLVAGVSAEATHYMDTNNTLRLAARAQQIRNLVSHTFVPGDDFHIAPMWQILPAEVFSLFG